MCKCGTRWEGFGCARVGSASVGPKKINKGGAGWGDLATQQQHLSGSEVKKQHETN